jgi:sterol desaturase/sphingolipid hydroxylase (fatty acid hydroxylase superfamily)
LHELATTAGDFISQYAWRLCYSFAALTVLECVFPTVRGSFTDRARAIGFWAVYLILTTAGMSLFLIEFSRLGWHPLFDLDFIGAPFVGLMIADFFYYWFHRVQHRNGWLWRFHAVHHSFRDMNAVNSPHHFTEELFRIPFVMLPTLLLFRVGGATPALLMTVFSLHGYYIHSSTRLSFGPLRWLITDNRMHRVHHSLDPAHFDTNFASITPLWDVLFGTAVAPPKVELLATGLNDLPQPVTVLDYLLRPFRRVSV